MLTSNRYTGETQDTGFVMGSGFVMVEVALLRVAIRMIAMECKLTVTGSLGDRVAGRLDASVVNESKSR